MLEEVGTAASYYEVSKIAQKLGKLPSGGWGCGGGIVVVVVVGGGIVHQASEIKIQISPHHNANPFLPSLAILNNNPLLFSAEARFKIGFRIDFDRNCFSGIMSEFRPSIKSTWGEGRGKLIEGYGPGGRRFIIRGKVDCVRMAVMIWSLQFQDRSAYWMERTDLY